MTRKIKHIIGIIWWQFRKKKIKMDLFERIRQSHSKARVSNSHYKSIEKIVFN